MKKIGLAFIAALFAVSFATAPAQAGDADKGATYAKKKCTMCHSFGDKFKKKGKVGPSLEAGIIGKKAGQVADYKYSKAMEKAAEGGLTWDDGNMDEYLTSPKKFLKGTKMSSFPGIKKADDRADVIAFLNSL